MLYHRRVAGRIDLYRYDKLSANIQAETRKKRHLDLHNQDHLDMLLPRHFKSAAKA